MNQMMRKQTVVIHYEIPFEADPAGEAKVLKKVLACDRNATLHVLPGKAMDYKIGKIGADWEASFKMVPVSPTSVRIEKDRRGLRNGDIL